MTSEKELRKIARDEVQKVISAVGRVDITVEYGDRLDDDEIRRVSQMVNDWPIPDLPEPDNAIPGWEVGDLSIAPGAANGSVSLDWEKPYDPVYGAVCRTLNLTPSQVQAIIAAHYHRKDQEC